MNLNMKTKSFKINIIYKIYSTFNIIQPYINNLNLNKIIYFCSGLKSLQTPTKIYLETDIEPFKTSDIRVVNSNITYNYIKKYFTDEINIINTSIIFKEIAIKNLNEFDIIFTTSSYKRITKNASLALQILSHPNLKKYKKIIIGNDFPNSIHNIENLFHKNIVSNKEFISILKKTRILLIPSNYDSMPNVLYEAIVNGVIPYISKTIECNLIPENCFFDIESDIDIIIKI